MEKYRDLHMDLADGTLVVLSGPHRFSLAPVGPLTVCMARQKKHGVRALFAQIPGYRLLRSNGEDRGQMNPRRWCD